MRAGARLAGAASRCCTSCGRWVRPPWRGWADPSATTAHCLPNAAGTSRAHRCTYRVLHGGANLHCALTHEHASPSACLHLHHPLPRQAGIPVAISSDNVRDQFYAYGDLDMLEVFTQASRWLPFV